MCRFVVYLGNPIHLSSLTTDPENSLIHQSYDSKERAEPLNGDGFGIVWYAPDFHDKAVQFRSVSPAWNNQNLRHMAGAIKSRCVMAHVRAASPGLAVTELNAHPFVHGPYAFMHNGTIAGFRQIRRELLNMLDDDLYQMVAGSTDSECLFAHTLQLLRKSESPTPDRMAQALDEAIGIFMDRLETHGISGSSYVNAVLSNGREAVACRFTNAPDKPAESLHLHTGKLYTCRTGVPALLEADEDEHAVILSSEALTGDPSWKVVPEHSMVLIDASRRVDIRTMTVNGSVKA
jgi:glutamine amidotransferase